MNQRASPSKTIKQLCLSSIENTKDDIEYIFNKSDSLVVWLIGYSITGITLVISNLTDFVSYYKTFEIHLILTCFVLTIISGVVYRIIYFFYQMKFRNSMNHFKLLLTEWNSMSLNDIDIDSIENVDEILYLLNKNFGLDFSKLKKSYKDFEGDTKIETLNSLKTYYKNFHEWAKNDFKIGLKEVKHAMKTSFNLSDKKINKIYDNYSAKGINFLSIASKTLMISCFLFFIISIVLVVILYILN